jgi:AcrR family transcriptional regulator
VTPPALYRYFRNRDELITAVMVEGFRGLAKTLRAAPGARHDSSRLMTVARAYRGWALAHPRVYGLMFGLGETGPRAAKQGRASAVTQAAKACFEALLAEMPAQPWPAFRDAPPRLTRQMEAWRSEWGYAEGRDRLAQTLAGWWRLHGLVMMELAGHVGAVFGDLEALYEAEVRKWMFGLGPG